MESFYVANDSRSEFLRYKEHQILVVSTGQFFFWGVDQHPSDPIEGAGSRPAAKEGTTPHHRYLGAVHESDFFHGNGDTLFSHTDSNMTVFLFFFADMNFDCEKPAPVALLKGFPQQPAVEAIRETQLICIISTLEW